MIQRELQKLFTKEMNRKEFLAHIGAGALTIIGVTNLIKHLSEFNGSKPRPSSAGYGLSAYGGKKKS
ncbi:MAG: hypothetical protein ACXWLH_01475 [Candidatus Saccharimonadales bacterium]